MVGSRVYVGGLPFGVRERDLEKFFKGFGRIRDILIKNGYGFVVRFFYTEYSNSISFTSYLNINLLCLPDRLFKTNMEFVKNISNLYDQR